MKQLTIELLSPASIMFGIAYERMILPHPEKTEEAYLTACTEFRIGLLFLQVRFRMF
jgi:hypothetical protein